MVFQRFPLFHKLPYLQSIELGILVWQDFQFSCGVYPAHDEFVDNVKVEAEQNVKRLRHHPSIVLFCGNNEDYQQVLQWGGKPFPYRILVIYIYIITYVKGLVNYRPGRSTNMCYQKSLLS